MVVYRSGAAASDQTGELFADEACTTPAEVYADNAGVKGALISDSRITLDGYGRQPDYWGPADGTDHLYLRVNGVVSRVDADYDARLDARLETATAAATYMTLPQPGIGAILGPFADRMTGPVVGVAVGSSLVYGSLATPTTRHRWSTLVGKMLQASYNPTGITGGYGLLGADTAWNFGGSFATPAVGL